MTARPTILVTGGAGYIGSHVVLALRDSGWPVVAVDNLVTGVASLVPQDVALVQADCGDAGRMRALLAEHAVGAVMHFAASTVVPESVADPMTYYLNNTVNTARLIAACIGAGVGRFIYSSTAAVYGEAGASFVSEEEPPRPVSPYGKSKLMGEDMLADAARAHPFRFVALRYFNVAGADPAGRSGQATPQATHLVKVACQAAAGVRPFMEIYGSDYDTPDGTCVRDYIHVSDLADAHIAALDRLMSGADSADRQLRLRAGLFRAGGDRRRAPRLGSGFRCPQGVAPPGRRGAPGLRLAAHARALRLEAEARPPGDDRADRLRLGMPPARRNGLRAIAPGPAAGGPARLRRPACTPPAPRRSGRAP